MGQDIVGNLIRRLARWEMTHFIQEHTGVATGKMARLPFGFGRRIAAIHCFPQAQWNVPRADAEVTASRHPTVGAEQCLTPVFCRSDMPGPSRAYGG